MPVLALTLLANVTAAALGFSTVMLLVPATGELGDAARLPLAVSGGLVALVLSGVLTAWIATRRGAPRGAPGMADPAQWARAIQRRRHARPGKGATAADLEEIGRALAVFPHSVELWVLRGDFVQLQEDPEGLPLAEALRSYERAHELAPDHPEPAREIAHYLDAVAGDPEAARPWFDKARALAREPQQRADSR